jgi:hypothetical protein
MATSCHSALSLFYNEYINGTFRYIGKIRYYANFLLRCMPVNAPPRGINIHIIGGIGGRPTNTPYTPIITPMCEAMGERSHSQQQSQGVLGCYKQNCYCIT